ncbi:hypothetical protein EOL96_06625 [Candidatus Saccharibacteria bacterium]|nr:hypothetical protein [Candidatus Saccharibacteria bacterium]
MAHYNSRSSRYSDDSWSVWFTVIVLIVLAFFLISSLVYTFRTYDQTITLCYKERVATSDSGEYRVYAVEGTFVMKDSLFSGVRFDTADEYARLQVPSTVDAELKGFRRGFLHKMPNIMQVDYHPDSTESARQACIAEGIFDPAWGN